MYRYKSWNSAMATTAAQAAVATGTSIKTMLQIAPPSTVHGLTVISWGYTVDGPPGAAGVIELLQTDVAATVTAHVAAGVQPLDGNMEASKVTLGTGATGYTATVEGAITATRVFDAVTLSSTTAQSPLTYSYQFMPDERPIVNASKFLRIRATTPTSGVNMRCWIVWDE